MSDKDLTIKNFIKKVMDYPLDSKIIFRVNGQIDGIPIASSGSEITNIEKGSIGLEKIVLVDVKAGLPGPYTL